MQVSQYESLEGLYAGFMDQAIQDWRDEYYPRLSVQDAFAERVRCTTFASKRFPGGVYHLSCRVRSRQPQQDEWYFAKVSAVGNTYYMH